MAKAVYDPTIRVTEHGARLYETWKRIRKFPYDPAWNSFPVFYDWAMAEGYILGDRLVRLDESRPYGPDNCYWKDLHDDAVSVQWVGAWCEKWDQTVERLRKHFGLPPLKGERS